MKLTLNTHDIYALVTEFKSLEDYRVLNIYDIDSKTICIKLNSNQSEKKYLIIESGIKFYLIDNFSALKDMPSSFCSKLRKHLKNKRLVKITQVNLDRVIDLTFGSGEMEFHIIGEFYASGNIIFTSFNYTILTLLHPYTYKTKLDILKEDTLKEDTLKEDINATIKTKVCVGHIYPFELATQSVELNAVNLIQMFEKNLLKLDKKITLKQFVNKLPIIKFSSNVIEHSLYISNINLSQKISSETKFNDIFKDSSYIDNFINEINKLFKQDKFEGYKTANNIYPYAYSHLNLTTLTSTIHNNFTIPLSYHFQSIKPIETKEIINEKVLQIKTSKQEKVIYNIEQQIILMENNIKNIEKQIDILTNHIDYIQNYINTVLIQKLLNYNEMDNEFFKFIEIIQYKHKIKFELEKIEFEVDYSQSIFIWREELYSKIKKILSKLSNARILLEKQKKLLKLNDINLTATTDTTNTNTTNTVIVKDYIILGQSKSNWFEQFNWFFTSDNLLFISGKTSDQNELIVKKYMEDSDIYIHSDSFGSGSGLLKNPFKFDIPEKNQKSLIECGNFLIAHTKAWESCVGNSAYWVKSTQVSKTPESGEYVSKGSFIIRGQKNFIRVDHMELGFGIIFKIIGKDGFWGNIKKDEQIEYAIPILSTYSALSSYKFKIKIIHGTQKITKVLKEVISSFIKKSNLSEKEAIKKISNDSIQKVLINKIKFVPIK